MRGKQGKAAAARRAKNLDAAIETARGELEAERHLLAEVTAEQAVCAALSERLAVLTAARERSVAPELARLEAEVAALREYTREADHLCAEMQSEWDAVSDSVIEVLGGGANGVEGFMHIVAVNSGLVVDDRLAKLGLERAQQIEVARGVRRRVRPTGDKHDGNPVRPLRGLLHPELDRHLDREAEDGTPPPPDVLAAGEAVDRAPWTSATRDTLYTWHPFPWVGDVAFSDSEHPAAKWLGYTPVTAELPEASAAISAVTRCTPALSAAHRSSVAGLGPKRVIDAWQPTLVPPQRLLERWPTPFSVGPLHTTPGDAAAVHHWYRLASLGQWTRADVQSPEQGYSSGLIAVAAASAPVYWLPPAQTFDILDSEPLTDTEDLRLPYPQVFLMFAEPPELPPLGGLTGDAQEAARRAAGLIEAALLTEQRNSTQPPMRTFGSFVASDPSDPEISPVWDLLAVRGARVEGVLLLADSLGNLQPQAAWALAIPAVSGLHFVQRLLVPIAWETSAWRDQILNAAAVVAWADWHHPLDVADGEEAEPGAQGHSHADGSEVRILAVRRTRAEGGEGVPTGRTVAAHVRRGHWRRQHHGPRGELVKRIRIAPTIVNAGQRSFAARIYRLPSA